LRPTLELTVAVLWIVAMVDASLLGTLSGIGVTFSKCLSHSESACTTVAHRADAATPKVESHLILRQVVLYSLEDGARKY
jgi:hypothetical protein